MTIDSWLQWALADAERRGLPELKPLLEGLARSLRSLRNADFNERADGLDGNESLDDRRSGHPHD